MDGDDVRKHMSATLQQGRRVGRNDLGHVEHPLARGGGHVQVAGGLGGKKGVTGGALLRRGGFSLFFSWHSVTEKKHISPSNNVFVPFWSLEL